MEKILLIVDDNKDIVDVVQSMVEDLFDRIESASTVESALELLDGEIFSAIILDINLDGRNGAEVVKYLIDNPDNFNQATPVVILSGIITPEFTERYQRRFAGILTKPVNSDELRSLLENLFID